MTNKRALLDALERYVTKNDYLKSRYATVRTQIKHETPVKSHEEQFADYCSIGYLCHLQGASLQELLNAQNEGIGEILWDKTRQSPLYKYVFDLIDKCGFSEEELVMIQTVNDHEVIEDAEGNDMTIETLCRLIGAIRSKDTKSFQNFVGGYY